MVSVYNFAAAWLGLVALLVSLASLASAQAPSLDALQQAARTQRQDPAAQAAYGRALLRAGRYADAQRSLAAAAQLQRGSQEPLYDVARVAFARGDYRAAQRACQPIARLEKGGVWSRVCQARTFLVWNRSERAFEELQAALAASPSHFEALLALGDAHRLRADIAQAEAAYQRASAVNAQSSEPALGLGRLYLAARRITDAVAQLRVAMVRDPDSPDVLYELGRALGNSPEALQLLTRAIAGRPNWAEPLVVLGTVALAAGDAGAAANYFQNAVRLNRQLAEAQIGLGRALAAQGDFRRAERSIRTGLSLVPNSPSAGLALAELFERSNRTEEAFEQYRHAADLDPNGSAVLRAAELALRLDRNVLAAGYVDRALRTAPTLGAGLALYGDIMAARNDRAQAAQYYRRALSEGTGDFDRARVTAALNALNVR